MYNFKEWMGDSLSGTPICCKVLQSDVLTNVQRRKEISAYEYMKERYPDKELARTDPNKDHDKKQRVKEYKENQDLKHELEQERQRLLAKGEHLKDIDRQLTVPINSLNRSAATICK